MAENIAATGELPVAGIPFAGFQPDLFLPIGHVVHLGKNEFPEWGDCGTGYPRNIPHAAKSSCC